MQGGSRQPPRQVAAAGGREPLPERVVESTAEYLRAIAKAKSIRLLEELSGGEASVQELADRLGLAHQNASHHLAALWRAGILARRSDGLTVLYEIEDWSAWWVIEQLARSLRPAAGDRVRAAAE
jgi:DNA-binding transcriptional ArsR family regulator